MKNKKIKITKIEKYLILLLFLYTVNTLPGMGAVSNDHSDRYFGEDNPFSLQNDKTFSLRADEDDDIGGPPHDDLPVPPVPTALPVGDEMLPLGVLILIYGGVYLLKKNKNIRNLSSVLEKCKKD